MNNRFNRRTNARNIRIQNAEFHFNQQHDLQVNNGDESRYAARNYFCNYSKGLPHDDLGEVDRAAYEQLVLSTQTGANDAYENIPMGLPDGRKLVNPQAGWNYDVQGGDGQSYVIPPAPRFDSAEAAAEMVELYWMALTRDVCFSEYHCNPLIANAVNDINKLSDYHGLGHHKPEKQGKHAKHDKHGHVNEYNIFRSDSKGNEVGPYISQFLWLDIPFGTLCISQMQKTAVGGVDYLTNYADWLHVQNGKNTNIPFDPCKKLSTDKGVYEPHRLYIRNLRDLTHYVHFDALYEAYLNACLILLGMNAPKDAGNPYNNSKTQIGFGTFGGPHILSLVTEVATRALKAVWHQKWNVNRRFRPEVFGGRVHNHMTDAQYYPIHHDLLHSAALQQTHATHGSYLLPQAFPEGSPMHPSYGAGHATVAAACATILKAWFDESFVLPYTVQAACDGTCLNPYEGDEVLTVGGELNKLAANISIGRNAAGVHYWTDYTASRKLGEDIAISILEEQKATYNERGYFSLNKFDGTTIKI